jgi:hypothetical protein
MAAGKRAQPMNELALFAGAGGGILGGHMLGWRTVCAVERDAYAAQVLAQRQNDGALRPFPIWSDVCSFDGRPWRGVVDVVSGGFPCQDISVAGKGAGITANDPGCGPTWRASLAKFDPSSSSWKTAQLSLLGDSDESSVTWPRSGMTAAGQCWELPMLGRRIKGIDFGLCPRPRHHDRVGNALRRHHYQRFAVVQATTL